MGIVSTVGALLCPGKRTERAIPAAPDMIAGQAYCLLSASLSASLACLTFFSLCRESWLGEKTINCTLSGLVLRKLDKIVFLS